MSTLLLTPHADDESLFAFYTLLREDADVMLVLDPGEARRDEFALAMQVSGRTPERWFWNSVPESDPNWEDAAALTAIVAAGYDKIVAPAYEEGGHEHHNAVAMIAATIDLPTIRYLTYRRGFGRTTSGLDIDGTPAERDLKLAALQCYQSQWENPDTAPWFPGGAYSTFLEWIA